MTGYKNVAIVGAGIAGLSCAIALQKAGFKVTVFEKSRGVSGRLSTRITADWQCDHGAKYFTARNPLFEAEVQRWVKAEVAQLWQPNLQTYDGNAFLPKEHEKSAKTKRFVGYPANNSPAKWLAKTLTVQCETTITNIQKNAQYWQLSSKEHGIHAEHFNLLILAIPAPQAAVLLKNNVSQTNATPILANLAAGVVMQPCFALMVQFKQKVDCAFDGLFINTGSLSWIARDIAKPGRIKHANVNDETWVLHATSQWSNAHVDDEKETIAHQMLAEFFKIINHAQYFDNTKKRQKTSFSHQKVMICIDGYMRIAQII